MLQGMSGAGNARPQRLHGVGKQAYTLCRYPVRPAMVVPTTTVGRKRACGKSVGETSILPAAFSRVKQGAAGRYRPAC